MHLGGERHCEKYLTRYYCKNTTHCPGQGLNPDCLIQREVHITPLQQKRVMVSIFSHNYLRTDFHVCFGHRLSGKSLQVQALLKENQITDTLKMFYRGIEGLLDFVRNKNAGIQQCLIFHLIIGNLFFYLIYMYLIVMILVQMDPLEQLCDHLNTDAIT